MGKNFSGRRGPARCRRPLAKRLSRAFRHFRQRVLKRDKLTALLFRELPSGKVLDIGCGGGGVISRLPAGRYEPHGIEISRALAAQANALARARGGRVVQANAIAGLAQLAPESLDAALLSGFLEHETQPALLLRELRRVLRAGAPVIVKVPELRVRHPCRARGQMVRLPPSRPRQLFHAAQPRAAGGRLRFPRRPLHAGRPLAPVGQPLGRAAEIKIQSCARHAAGLNGLFPCSKFTNPFLSICVRTEGR